MKHRVLLILLSLVAGLLIAAATPAQPPPVEGMITLEDAINSLRKPGVVTAVVGICAAWAAVYIPRFQKLTKMQKRPIFLGISLVVPVAGSLLGVLLLKWALSIDLFWYALQAGGWSFAAGTLAHGFFPQKK